MIIKISLSLSLFHEELIINHLFFSFFLSHYRRWNDPINDKELANILMIENGTWRLRNFLPNSRRGTAFLYTDRATKIFCEKNQIDFILRAHEVYDQGFRFHHHGIVLTVFSCSKYSNLNNQASVLFVSGEKIRIIQIQSDDG